MNQGPDSVLNSSTQAPKRKVFEIHQDTIRTEGVYASSVPKDITARILARKDLPKELPLLGSSIVEDHIIKKLKAGTVSPDEIIDTYFSDKVVGQSVQFIEQVRQMTAEIDWSTIFNSQEVKKNILTQMARMNMTPDQQKLIEQTEIILTDNMGTSGSGGISNSRNEVVVSKAQAVRKALDYIKVFGTPPPIERVIQALVMATSGHELGHKISDIASSTSPVGAISFIPLDKNWDRDGNSNENQAERFSEYWGRVAIQGDTTLTDIRDNEKILQVAKVAEVWNTIEQHNNIYQDNKIDPVMIMATIVQRIRTKQPQGVIKDSDVIQLIEARSQLYLHNPPEVYALPYPEPIVFNAITKTLEIHDSSKDALEQLAK